VGRSPIETQGCFVTTRAEQYRIQAKECAERAKLARDPEMKRQYEDMAKQWLDLTKRVEEGGGGA
jgi:hypothetical protein